MSEKGFRFGLKMMGAAGVLLLAQCLVPTAAFAQHGGGPGGGGGAPGGGGMGGPGGMSGPGSFGSTPNNNSMHGNTVFGTSTTATSAASAKATMRGAIQFGPPGRWWDDKKYVQTLGLRTDQKKNMDAVFNANKGAIQQRLETLQQEETKMEALTKDTHLQEAMIFAQVDRVSQARAGLEKATAHLSLLLRQEMDAAQIAKLEEMQGIQR